jgi:predicted permease
MSLGDASYPKPEQRQAFFEELETRLNAMPGAEAFALSDEIPPSGRMHAKPYNGLEVNGEPRQSDEAGGMVGWRIVTPGYFSALRIPIVRGRGFNETDRAPNASLIVLSQTLAQRLLGNRDALGARIRLEPHGPWYTVIGVAGNVKNAGVLAQDDPEYYVVRKHEIGAAASEDHSPIFDRRASIIIRSSLAPGTVANWIRGQVSTLDPTLPIDIETMNARVGKLAARPRFNASVLTIFAVIGVLLAAIGLYGVVSFLVAQRTQEIGIRMALGATPRDITRLVLARASRWTAAGILLGLIGSLAAGRVMAAVLYQVSGGDARTLGVSMAILALIALVAAWIPSRRAARIDPVEALRRE